MYNETNLELPPPSHKAEKVNGVKHKDEEQMVPIMLEARGDQRVIAAANEGIVVSNVTAKWTDQVSDNTLSHINLRVTPGKLTAIIGPVGSGKVNIHPGSVLRCEYCRISLVQPCDSVGFPKLPD